MTNYIGKIKNLYENFRDKFFQRKNNSSKMSIEEITELMKHVPYENIKDKLPIEFANKVHAIGGTCVSSSYIFRQI